MAASAVTTKPLVHTPTPPPKAFAVLLGIENVVVASNWAGTSEGGGIHARTSYMPLNSNPNDDSYINAGYLTNNMTATTWDYGGVMVPLKSSV